MTLRFENLLVIRVSYDEEDSLDASFHPFLSQSRLQIKSDSETLLHHLQTEVIRNDGINGRTSGYYAQIFKVHVEKQIS
jgi:hypothetical protein